MTDIEHIVPEQQLNDLLNDFLFGLRKQVYEWFEEADLSSYEILKVLEATLKMAGDLWSNQTISLTQIYVSSRIAEEIVEHFVYNQPSDESNHGRSGRIVIGAIQEDTHALGKNIVKRFLDPFFEVHDLGIDVQPIQFIERAKQISADVIAVSGLMATSFTYFGQLRQLIDGNEWEGGKPRLLVGGAPFVVDPSLASRLGADAYASNAFDAVEKCFSLVKEEGRV